MKKAEGTRRNILERAFELIYERGYQNTSIDDILATTRVTKGAFYYHFQNKDEMGLAIIHEVLKPKLSERFMEPLQKEQDPLRLIYNLMHHLLMKDSFMKQEFGCPVSNLSQEMAPGNSDFSNALNEVTEQWKNGLIVTLANGKKSGIVRKDVNEKEAVIFIISGYWGVRNLGKLTQSKTIYQTYLRGLKAYLESLRN